jgi:hypothetical protein
MDERDRLLMISSLEQKTNKNELPNVSSRDRRSGNANFQRWASIMISMLLVMCVLTCSVIPSKADLFAQKK